MYSWVVKTKSVTPAGLPHAGSYAKHHHLKQKVQKTKDIPKIWVLMGKQFEDFRQKKKRKIFLDISQNPSGTPGL